MPLINILGMLGGAIVGAFIGTGTVLWVLHRIDVRKAKQYQEFHDKYMKIP